MTWVAERAAREFIKRAQPRLRSLPLLRESSIGLRPLIQPAGKLKTCPKDEPNNLELLVVSGAVNHERYVTVTAATRHGMDLAPSCSTTLFANSAGRTRWRLPS